MDDAVIQLGRRAGVDPHFFAFALAEYAARERLDEPALARLLGTTVDGLAKLRLCPTPRAEHFADDVEKMAARFHLDADAVATVARFGHVLARLRPDPDAAAAESAAPFLAARDQPPS